LSTTRPFKFDAKKALEVILYIANRAPIPDIYHICKVLYFADRQHLEDFGRLVCGDEYFALPYGPVPEGTYNLLKDAKYRHRESLYAEQARSAIAVNGNWVKPSRDANMELLSQSDIMCLNKAIEENGSLPFGVLKDKSHDAAYHSANINGEIPVEAIAATLRDSEELIEELRE
jgi:uncharacterized phage-associated protein